MAAFSMTCALLQHTLSLGEAIWSKSGDYGDYWLGAAVNVTSSQRFFIIFEAVRGSAHRGMPLEIREFLSDVKLLFVVCVSGDISIDDLQVFDYPCSDEPLPTFPPIDAPTPAPTPWDCDFELGWCDWTNDADQALNWTRQQGPTPSTLTGPTTDHTTQSAEVILCQSKLFG